MNLNNPAKRDGVAHTTPMNDRTTNQPGGITQSFFLMDSLFVGHACPCSCFTAYSTAALPAIWSQFREGRRSKSTSRFHRVFVHLSIFFLGVLEVVVK